MIALLRRLWCALRGHPGKETIGEDAFEGVHHFRCTRCGAQWEDVL